MSICAEHDESHNLVQEESQKPVESEKQVTTIFVDQSRDLREESQDTVGSVKPLMSVLVDQSVTPFLLS